MLTGITLTAGQMMSIDWFAATSISKLSELSEGSLSLSIIEDDDESD